MSSYVCEIDGEYVEAEKTGREARNQFSGAGTLVEMQLKEKVALRSIGSDRPALVDCGVSTHWVPSSKIFEIGGYE